MEWQPIETAPKDGSVVFVWHDTTTHHDIKFDINIKKAYWNYGWSVEGVGGNVPPKITHWMPLPKPPGGKADG